MGEWISRVFPFAIAVLFPPAGLLLGLAALQQEDRDLAKRLIVVSALAASSGSWSWPPDQGSGVRAASANGLPSESRQTAQRSPGWTTEPPSAPTRSIAAGRSATVK